MHIGTIKMIHLRPLQVASIGCPYKYLHMSRSCKFGLRIPDTGDRPYGTESQKGNFKGITSTMLPLCISGSSVPPPWGPHHCFSLPVHLLSNCSMCTARRLPAWWHIKAIV